MSTTHYKALQTGRFPPAGASIRRLAALEGVSHMTVHRAFARDEVREQVEAAKPAPPKPRKLRARDRRKHLKPEEVVLVDWREGGRAQQKREGHRALEFYAVLRNCARGIRTAVRRRAVTV
jgi:hypothetical protein